MADGKKSYIGFNTCRLAIKVKAGTTGCNITCPEMDDDLTGASSSYLTGVTAADKKGLFEGEQSNPDKEYDANGDMYLTWYVQISKKNASNQPFNFTLTNQLNSQNDYITHFQLKIIDPRLNPLYYMTESYVKSYNTTTKVVTFEPDPKVLNSMMYCVSSAMQKFSATHSVAHYDGYRSCDVTDGSTSFTYHLGTLQEWRSIIPCPTADNSAASNMFKTSWTSGLRTEPICVFGYDTSTKAGITEKSYWSDFTTGSYTRYAIRFLDTDYCSVWKYEYKNNMAIISSKLIDPISSSDSDALTAMMTTITNAADSYWEEDEDSGTIQRFLYGSGKRNGNSDGATTESQGKFTWIMIATTINSEILDCEIGYDGSEQCWLEPSMYSSWGFAVTLFREFP